MNYRTRTQLGGHGRDGGGREPVKSPPFAYLRPRTVGEAVTLLVANAGTAKILAGGQSLVPLMHRRLVRPRALIDVIRLPDLRHLTKDGDGLRVGALTRHRDVEVSSDPWVTGSFGILPAAATWIGSHPIRTRGTFGGSLVHADPGSEWCLLAVLLDAEIVVTGPDRTRVIAAADFFLGPHRTAMSWDELLVEVRFPSPALHAALQEFAARPGDPAVVTAAAAVELTDGRVSSARVAVGGGASPPVRVPEAEDILLGAVPTGAACAAAGARVATAVGALHAVAGDGDGYRRELARSLTARAVAQAAASALGNGHREEA